MQYVKTNDIPFVPDIENRDRLRCVQYPALVEVKYDGEYEYYRGGFLYNKYGAKRSDFPVVNELSRMGDIELIGELHAGEGKRAALYEFLTMKYSDDLLFKVIDVVRHDQHDFRKSPLVERREYLIELWNQTYPTPPTHIALGQVTLAEDEAEALEIFDQVVEEGYEGVVVKGLESEIGVGNVKLKYKTTADLVVVEIDPIQERVEVEVPGLNGCPSRRCGVKVMNHIKRTLSLGDMIEVEHQGVLSAGGLRHPVFKHKREPKRVSIDV